MSDAFLEHANITVTDPERTTDMLCKIFNWDIRWHGPAIDGGSSTHIGGKDSYLAIYAPKVLKEPSDNSYTTPGGLNHVGIVVDYIDATERRATPPAHTRITSRGGGFIFTITTRSNMRWSATPEGCARAKAQSARRASTAWVGAKA